MKNFEWLEIYETGDWGAHPPKVEKFEVTVPKMIIIHHMATGNPPNDISKGTLEGAKNLAKTVQGWHMDQNDWSDSGHHFSVTTGGFIMEGRHGTLDALENGKCVRGAHCINYNSHYGIENEGTFTDYHMSDKQWDTLVRLCALICIKCSIQSKDIYGHRDYDATNCPGDWLYGQLPKLRKNVHDEILKRKV